METKTVISEIVRVENVKKTYQDNGVPVDALKGINLSVLPGDFSVIAGPSGSGKTTLLNIIGTLDKPTEGKVCLDGVDVASKTRRELADIRLRKIGFVFQAYNLNPVLSALENVEFTMMLRGVGADERKRRGLALLNELGIGELAHKRPNEMSGGQQQRVAVARAISNDPRLVLADEPTANLDSETAIKLLELMEKLNREERITFVFSSHDPQVIEHAHRLLILKDGQIISDKNQ
ncbi:MAG TPA: ABC transporter ATP-binding protein [Candidatus Acidoferrales bacterium]|nr:ABC transporter ATP-binding protein [Candidatus Acidoferrales bacterium]